MWSACRLPSVVKFSQQSSCRWPTEKLLPFSTTEALRMLVKKGEVGEKYLCTVDEVRGFQCSVILPYGCPSLSRLQIKERKE